MTELFKKVYTCITFFCYPLSRYRLNVKYYSLCQFNLFLYPKKQTILFSFQGEPGLEDYLTRFVCQLLPQNVVPLFVSNKFISHKMVLETEVALVVCNYDFLDTTCPCPVLLLSYFPTKKEWLDLQQYIFKLAYPIND